jgi:glycosyltransferase involved in cell wall biosynthesis
MGGRRLSIAYVHYGVQSGVTPAVSRALVELGHEVLLVQATGGLEPRDPATRRLQPRAPVALHLAHAALRYGRWAKQHRWNTPFAFDAHSRRAGDGLRALPARPDLVLQNGALFAPGLPAPYPYALLVDHTRALAMRSPAWPQAGLPPPVDYGDAWRTREAEVYRRARVIAAFSEHAARSLVEDYAVEPERVRVVGAGANVYPDVAPRCDDGKTIVFLGKDFRRKGGTVLLEAFARVRRRVPRARLLVAGPPQPPPLPERVFYLGEVPFPELPALLAQTSLVALPTLREPFGLALLDAMACGVPVVATRVEAVPEIVEHGATGLLVPPADPDALADALVALLSDPAGARAMGQRGRARVAERFLWRHAAGRLERALAEAGAHPGKAA